MNVQDITQKLGKHANLVTIEQAIDCFIVKPRHFLNQEKQWQPVNKILRQENSKWIPIPGAIGHWEIPFVEQSEVDSHGRLQTALEHAREMVKLLEEEMK